MARKKHLINVHTSTGTTAPTGASLYLGEIAVQHTPNDPALWIKMGSSESSTEYEKFIGKTEITNLIQASNILGSGYTYSGIPYVNSATTIADAYSALTKELIDDELVTASALNDLNVRLGVICGATNDISSLYDRVASAETVIQQDEEAVAGALNNLNERLGTVETQMTGDYIPITGYMTASGSTEEELTLNEGDTVNEALGKLQKQMLDNEEAIAAGLNDLNERVIANTEAIAQNTGVTALSGAVMSLSSATYYGLDYISNYYTTTSSTRALSSATQSLSASVMSLSAKTNGVLTLNLNGVEQGKYSPSASTTINLEAIQEVTGDDVLLTGYELATGTTEEELAIVATDTVNEAFGKIQKQNYDNEAVVAGALNDLDERITLLEVSGSSGDDLEELSGAVVSKEIVIAAALNDLNSRIVELSGNTGGAETDPVYSSSIAATITQQDIDNWNAASGGGSSDPNAITGITMNGNAVSVSSRVAALGTVVTAQTQLSKGTVTGNGNVVTDINVSNHQITLVKSYSAAPADQFVTLSGAAHNKITALSAGTISVSGFAHNKITALSAATTAHTANTTVHITSEERTAWNNKVSNVQADWNTTATTDGSYIKNKPTIPTVPTSNTAFTNDAGYITGYTETDPTVPAWAKASSKPTYTASEVGALATGATLDDVADGTTRKLSNYATTGTVNTLSGSVTGINATLTAHTTDTGIHVTSAEKSTWDGKQDAISDLTAIRNGSNSGASAYTAVTALSAATTAMSTNVGKIAVTGVTVDGTGNAITNAAYSNSALTLTKGNVLTAETLTGVSAGGTNLTVTNKIAAIPSASSSTFGVVKTGNFITNTNGSIAVSTGTTNTTVARGDQFLAVSAATTGNTSNLNTLSGAAHTKITNLSAATTAISTNLTTLSGAAHTKITNLSAATTAHTATTIANGTSSQMHLPTVSASDNGKILRVVNGAWALVEPATIYYGSGTPAQSLGNDGDIYIQTS